MSVTDYKFAGTAISDPGTGTNKWNNPDYAKADDTSYSGAVSSKYGVTETIRLTNYGFTSSDIPTGATINGIELVVCRHSNYADSVNDNALHLYSSGDIGNNLASATKWPLNTPTEATYGGPTNMWGTTLSQSDIVASTFGCTLIAQMGTNIYAYIDYIKIRVYYTEGGASVKPYYYYLNQ